MSKKKGIFDIQIEQALTVIIKQLEVSGYRERTLYDYRTIVHYFNRDTKVEFLIVITSDDIYAWLEKMYVKNTTKLTPLKCFKAFLARYFDDGWLTKKFWRSVYIKVDTEIKVGATEEDVNLLLSVLDYTKFLELRSATAFLLMYRCGLRIGTIAPLKEQQVDFVYQRLQLDGEVIKNHKGSILPVDEQMLYLLQVILK